MAAYTHYILDMYVMFPDFLPFEWLGLLYTKSDSDGGYPNGNKGTHHLALTTLKRVRSS